MKTFIEHIKNRLPNIGVSEEVLKENEKDLLKDLQGLGINEETFSISDLEDAWGNSIFEDAFIDGTYSNITEELAFKTENSAFGDDLTEVEVEFVGEINLTDANTNSIIKSFIGELVSNDDNFDQERWSFDSIKNALGDVSWDMFIDVDTSEVKAEIRNVSFQDTTASIEYGIKEDSYEIKIDLQGMWDEFTSYLE